MGTEAKLSQISTDYIYNETVASFLLLLSSCMEDRQTSAIERLYPLPEALKQLKEKIHRQTAALEETLANAQAKEAAMEEDLAMKKELLDIYRVIHAYYPLWDVVATPLADERMRREFAKNPEQEKEVAYQVFYADCIDFIQSGATEVERRANMGKLLQAVPLRMAREKYYDLVRESLMLVLQGESENRVEEALRVFHLMNASWAAPDFGTYFPEMGALLKEKLALKPSQMTDEELEDAYASMQELLSAIEDMEDFCQETLNGIYSLLLLHYMQFDLDELTEKEFGYRDLYFKIVELMDHPEDDTFDETIQGQLEGYIEPLLDRANELNRQEMPLLEKIKDPSSLPEQLQKLLATEGFVRHTMFNDIKEEIFELESDAQAPAAEESWLKEQVDKFLQTLRADMNQLSAVMRKAAMGLLLGSLPSSWDVMAVMDQVKNTIDQASSAEERLLVIDKVGAMFAETGFDPAASVEDDCTCGHDHHHHGDDCTCGHDHHHHHGDDYTCGHGHHHHPEGLGHHHLPEDAEGGC